MTTTETSAFDQRAESAKLKHTPSPWQSRHEWDWDGLCSIIGNIDGDTTSPTFTSVCDIDEGCDEFLANRNLICAAPDLLSIAKRWAVLYAPGAEMHTPHYVVERTSLLADTREAINRATGAA